MTAAALLPPLLAAAGILALAGVAKLAQPAAAAAFLGSLGLPRSTVLVRAGALLELAVAAAVVARPVPAAAAIALLFSAFAVVTAVRLRRGSGVPCGCFGERETPPSRVHLALNLACAATGIAAALAHVPAYSTLASTAPAEAAVALLAAVAAALLAQAGLVLLPPTLGAWSGGRRA